MSKLRNIFVLLVLLLGIAIGDAFAQGTAGNNVRYISGQVIVYDESSSVTSVDGDGLEVNANALRVQLSDGTLTRAAGGLSVSTDGVGLTQLDDDANTPVAGDIMIVETGAASVDYITPDAGTDVTADLEEEGQINASDVTGNAADDQVILGSAANTLGYATIPNCVGDNMLTYTQATNTFGCDADDGAGGSGVSIASPTELTIATGAVTFTGGADTRTYFLLDTESDAASDDLDTCNCTAGSEVVVYAADDARTVNITCGDGPTFSLDHTSDRAELHCVATNTMQIASRESGSD